MQSGHPVILALCLSVCILCGCKRDAVREETPRPGSDVLVQVGDSVLYRYMVTDRIPFGLESADSLRMFDALVQSWLERNMLMGIAGHQLPDMDKIDRLVEEYRMQLVANEYRRLMAAQHISQADDDAVRRHYEDNPGEYITDEPLIKGIYLKVDESSPSLDEVRGWLKGGTSEDIDNLESYGLKGAMEYQYFGDQWLAWSTVIQHIPARFAQPDEFVEHNKFFETERDGIVYMLRVLDYLPSGSREPYEFAKGEIALQMIEHHRADYDKKLLKGLYEQGLSKQTIKEGTYTPLMYRKETDHNNK